MTQQFTTLNNNLTLWFGESVQLTGEVVHDQDNAMLYLVTHEDSEALSINLDQYGLTTPAGHVWIKNWSEHTGVATQLLNRGVVTHAATATVGPFNSPADLVQITTHDHHEGITMREYEITDIHTDQTVAGQDWEEVMATVHGWFGDAPQEVLDALEELENNPDMDPHVAKNFLGLIIDYGPADNTAT